MIVVGRSYLQFAMVTGSAAKVELPTLAAVTRRAAAAHDGIAGHSLFALSS
jgi:hypothetical protein